MDTHLNPVVVLGVYGEGGAACMAGRYVLYAVRAAHWVEGTPWARAVGITPVRRRCLDRVFGIILEL